MFHGRFRVCFCGQLQRVNHQWVRLTSSLSEKEKIGAQLKPIQIDVFTGPTAILALLIQHYVAENADFAVFITFVSGLLIFIFGLLNLGFLVQFISTPVMNDCIFLLVNWKHALIPFSIRTSLGHDWIHLGCSAHNRQQPNQIVARVKGFIEWIHTNLEKCLSQYWSGAIMGYAARRCDDSVAVYLESKWCIRQLKQL